MKRRHLLLILLVIASLWGGNGFVSLGASQTEGAEDGALAGVPDYYHVDGGKQSLSLSTDIFAIKFRGGVTVDEKRSLIESQDGMDAYSSSGDIPQQDIYLAKFSPGTTEAEARAAIIAMGNLAEVEYAAPAFVSPEGTAALTDEFIVRFDDSLSESEIERINGEAGVEVLEKTAWGEYLLKAGDPRRSNALSLSNAYLESGAAVYANPNFIVLTYLPAVPNDTGFPVQWALNQIDAPAAWEINKGSGAVKIAILDSGVDLSHEDLVAKLTPGYDFIDGDAVPAPTSWDNHGTAVAGAAAASTNNMTGVAGIDWKARIMPVRIFYRQTPTGAWWTTHLRISNGLRYAADKGAKVISNSWVVNPSDTVTSAIQYARSKGSTLLFAAGNDNGPVLYPAKRPEVIAVGASDIHDQKASFSNYGPELDILAPGEWIYTTDISGNSGASSGSYYLTSGTSVATPIAAGVVALLLAQNPARSPGTVQAILQATADDLGDHGRDNYCGYGRVNAYRALGGKLPL